MSAFELLSEQDLQKKLRRRLDEDEKLEQEEFEKLKKKNKKELYNSGGQKNKNPFGKWKEYRERNTGEALRYQCCCSI